MSGEVRLWHVEPNGDDSWRAVEDGDPERPNWVLHIALSAAEFHNMVAEARSYRAVLAALKTGGNAKLTFGQVMADLGLDQPPGEAVEMWVRYESSAVRALPSARKEGPG